MEQNQKKWPIITCPHCGYQHISAEIFMPGDFLGKPESVIRDVLGKLIYLEYEENSDPAQPEKYFCDNCDRPFIIEPVISFKVKKEVEELDFTETYTSLL